MALQAVELDLERMRMEAAAQDRRKAKAKAVEAAAEAEAAAAALATQRKSEELAAAALATEKPRAEAEVDAPLAAEELPCCSICFGEIAANDSCTTSCGHNFHFSCCARWMQTTNTCPYCRTKLRTEAEVEVEADPATAVTGEMDYSPLACQLCDEVTTCGGSNPLLTCSESGCDATVHQSCAACSYGWRLPWGRSSTLPPLDVYCAQHAPRRQRPGVKIMRPTHGWAVEIAE